MTAGKQVSMASLSLICLLRRLLLSEIGARREGES